VEKNMSRPGIVCTRCGRAYPSGGYPFHCPNCGGLFDISDGIYFNLGQVDRSQPGIWRYRHSFGLPPELEAVSLGEGNTPLVWAGVFGRQVAFKCEYLNPSGSFKDRGSTVIAAWLRGQGVSEAVEDSSGNAGASFAAYAARAGIKACIYVPESASEPKRRQIEAYGAKLVPVRGSRNAVAEAVKQVAETGTAYASHAYLPFNLSGYATAAYEVFEQLGQMPGTVIVPTGQGGLLLGLARGFNALRIADNIPTIPKMIGVQARACAPMYAMFTGQTEDPNTEEDNPTLAEGVRVRNPLRINTVLAAVKAGQGWMYAINETEIMPGREALARLGFYVEPTSAIVWPALAHFIDKLPDPIVLVLTGSGLKYG
jgi:threonine synthase